MAGKIRLFVLMLLLIVVPGKPLFAEEAVEEKGDAILKPLEPYGGFVRKLETGERIWTDRKYAFSNVPGELQGKGYIWSPMRYSEAVVEKQGYVYVITPTPVDKHLAGRFSKSAAGRVIPYFAPSLVERGFERMENIPEFQVSPGVKEQMAVYRKYAEEGEVVKYGSPSWGVTVAGLPENLEQVDTGGFSPRIITLEPPRVYTEPVEKYAFSKRNFQGIPGIEITPGGRLWVTLYACNCGVYSEGPENYAVLLTSGDGGKTWTDPPAVVIDPLYWPVRAFDPVPWHDPMGRLWFIWTQNDVGMGEGTGSWAVVAGDSESAKPLWSEPRRLAEGYMINKPVVLSTGEWVFPSSNPGTPVDLYVSEDKGKTISHLGRADVPRAGYNEHMVVERKDGSLWLLVRAAGGIKQSFSYDRGRTWTEGEMYRVGPSTRFHIRRLKSGRLLFITHPEEEGARMRTNMTAYLSEDDGKTWPYELLLDSREWVSYPDAVETADGVIYSVHDHSRTGKLEIVMSVFTEEDIMAGKLVSENSRLGVIVSGKDRR